jgi:hypothetical protein
MGREAGGMGKALTASLAVEDSPAVYGGRLFGQGGTPRCERQARV